MWKQRACGASQPRVDNPGRPLMNYRGREKCCQAILATLTRAALGMSHKLLSCRGFLAEVWPRQSTLVAALSLASCSALGPPAGLLRRRHWVSARGTALPVPAPVEPPRFSASTQGHEDAGEGRRDGATATPVRSNAVTQPVESRGDAPRHGAAARGHKGRPSPGGRRCSSPVRHQPTPTGPLAHHGANAYSL